MDLFQQDQEIQHNFLPLKYLYTMNNILVPTYYVFLTKKKGSQAIMKRKLCVFEGGEDGFCYVPPSNWWDELPKLISPIYHGSPPPPPSISHPILSPAWSSPSHSYQWSFSRAILYPGIRSSLLGILLVSFSWSFSHIHLKVSAFLSFP
jgi:hypothetical protein